MSNNAYLSVLSSQRLWQEYMKVVYLKELGLFGDFDIKFPYEASAFIDITANEFSQLVKRAGQGIGESHYKNFRSEKTRLSPDEIGSIWHEVRTNMQDHLDGEYSQSHKDPLIPGVKSIDVDRLIPVSDSAKSLVGRVSKKDLQDKLDEVGEGLTRDKFWETFRTVVFDNWQREFDLYKETENEPAREIPKK